MKKVINHIKGNRLIIVVYFLLFLLIGAARIKSNRSQKSIVSTYDYILDSSIHKLKLLREVKINAERIQNLCTTKTVLESVQDGANYDREVKERLNASDDSLRNYSFRLESPEEKIQYDHAYSAWLINKEFTIKLTAIRDSPGAINYFNNAQQPAYANFYNSINDLLKFVYDDIKRKDTLVDQMAFQSEAIVNLMIACVLILLVVLGVLIFRSVKNLNDNHALIKESEELYRSLFNGSPVFIWLTDIPNLRHLDVNQAAIEHYGYSKQEFLTMTAYELLAPEYRKPVSERVEKAMVNSCTIDRHVKKNGEIISVEIKVHIIDYKGNKAALVTGVDVTEKLKAGNDLLKNEARFRALIENSHDGIALHSPDGKILYITPSVERIMGYSLEEAKTADPREYIHPDDAQYLRGILEELVPKFGETRKAVYRMLHKNGEWRWLSSNITNMLHRPGVEAIVFNYEDCTEKKLADEKLIKSQANLRTIFNNTNTAFYLLDKDYRIVEFNKLSYDWVLEEGGQKLKTGSFYSDYVKEGLRESLKFMYDQVMSGEEVNVEMKVNLDRWYFVNMKRIMGEDSQVYGLCISTTDITAQKIAGEKVRSSEELYRFLFTNNPLPAFIAERETLRFVEVNNMALEKYGYSRKEFLELNAFDIRPEDEHAAFKNFLSFAIENQTGAFYRRHIKKNGQTIHVETYACNLRYEGKEAFLVLVNDITDRVVLQNELIEEKVKKQKHITRATINGQEKERNELGKELHDNVNQILATVKLYLESATVDTINQQKYLTSGTELVTKCINEIRRISRALVAPSLGELSLREAINELTEPLKLDGKVVNLEVQLKDEGLMADGLKIAIYRIVQEQLNNIIKYAEAGEIKILLHQHDRCIQLQVTDNGKGFDPNKKRKGIGITNMKNRAIAFNGKLIIDSSQGNGCTVNVQFNLKEIETNNPIKFNQNLN